MKTIWLVTAGAEDTAEGREAPLEPGTTAAQLLNAADMNPDHWQLYLELDDGTLNLSSHDELYDLVEDGEKVYVASTKMVVGAPA